MHLYIKSRILFGNSRLRKGFTDVGCSSKMQRAHLCTPFSSRYFLRSSSDCISERRSSSSQLSGMIVACGSFASTHVFTFPSLCTRIHILVDYSSVSTTHDYTTCTRRVRVLASNSSTGAPLVLLADVVVFGHVQEVYDGLRGQQQMLVQKIHLRAEWYT